MINDRLYNRFLFIQSKIILSANEEFQNRRLRDLSKSDIEFHFCFVLDRYDVSVDVVF